MSNGNGLAGKALFTLACAVVAAAFAVATAAYARAIENAQRVASLETHILYIRSSVDRIERKMDKLPDEVGAP